MREAVAGPDAAGGSTRPLVSVVVPTRNRPALLGELLRSLSAQSLAGWEAVVVDDGSDAAQLAAMRELARVDPRVRLLERGEGPCGANRCRNLGVAAARADLLVFFDDDDLLSPGCLAARVEAMRAGPDLDAVVFPYERFASRPGDRAGPSGPGGSRTPLDDYLRLEPPWHTGGPVWRRAFLDRIGPWDERLSSWQDWEFGIRALTLRPALEHRPGPAFHVRVPTERHRTVSLAGWEPRNVRSWALGVEVVLDLLAARGQMNPTRRALLAVLHLFVAERLTEIGERARAAELWEGWVERGPASRLERAAAAALLPLARIRGGRALAHQSLLRALHSRSVTRLLEAASR